MTAFAFTESVTWHRRTGSTTDQRGNEVPTFAGFGLDGCVVWPTAQSEDLVNRGDVITDGLTIYVPDGTTVDGLDEFTVRGARYAVDGDPAKWFSPFSGSQLTTVRLSRRS